jgi:DNA replication protein DnaC
MKHTTCALLVQDLLLAKRELWLSNLIKRLAKYDGLIIDEMGYVQQSREEMEFCWMSAQTTCICHTTR